jgi:hypothetical protein
VDLLNLNAVNQGIQGCIPFGPEVTPSERSSNIAVSLSVHLLFIAYPLSIDPVSPIQLAPFSQLNTHPRLRTSTFKIAMFPVLRNGSRFQQINWMDNANYSDITSEVISSDWEF